MPKEPTPHSPKEPSPSKLEKLPSPSLPKESIDVAVRIERDLTVPKEQAEELKDAKVIVPPSTESVLKLILSEDYLKYTSLGRIQTQEVQRMAGPWSSSLLETSTDGEFIVFRSKTERGIQLDGRLPRDRLAEYTIIGAMVRIIARQQFHENLREVIDLEVSESLKPYLSRISHRLGFPVWITHEQVGRASVAIYPTLTDVVIPFPRIDLPESMNEYPLPTPAHQTMIEPFVFSTNTDPRFMILTELIAEVYNVEIELIQEAAKEIKIDELITVTLERERVVIKAWKGEQSVRTRLNSQLLILLYIELKKRLKDIQYEYGHPIEVAPRIIKNSLWTTPAIMNSLIHGGFLKEGSVKTDQGVQIGAYAINRYPLNQTGINGIVEVFGHIVQQSEFIVRPYRRAEIITIDGSILRMIIDILEQNPEIFSVIQRTITGVVFEANGNTPYLHIMQAYFTIKYQKRIILTSELDPESPRLAQDALEHIALHTDFGGGNTPPYLGYYERNGTANAYIIGDANAVDAIIAPLPEEVKRDIVLQEIAPNVLGRRVGRLAHAYLSFMLS